MSNGDLLTSFRTAVKKKIIIKYETFMKKQILTE
jgi:hypothetical protein